MRARGTIPSPRAHHATALIDGSLYLLGGFDGKDAFDDAHALSIEHLKWRKLKLIRPLNSSGEPDGATLEKRIFFGHAAHKKIMYVIGGVNNQNMNDVRDDVLAYDTEASTLVTVETEGPSPGVISRPACATLGDSIWMFGGFNGKEWLDTMYRLRLPTAGGGRAYQHHTHRARWELVPTEVRSSQLERAIRRVRGPAHSVPCKSFRRLLKVVRDPTVGRASPHGGGRTLASCRTSWRARCCCLGAAMRRATSTTYRCFTLAGRHKALVGAATGSASST